MGTFELTVAKALQGYVCLRKQDVRYRIKRRVVKTLLNILITVKME